MGKTIIQVVDDVAAAARDIGIDVSSKDVGWMISLFLQALAEHPDGEPSHFADRWLLMIAEECDKVTDE